MRFFLLRRTHGRDARATTNPARLGRGDLDERLNRQPCALGGAGLDDLTEQHEERHDPGGLVIAAGERREHGDGDEFVDAQQAEAQIFDRRQDDRITKDDRPDEGAGAGDGVGVVRHPIHDKSVHHEHDTQQRLREADLRVRMFNAAGRARVTIVMMMLVLFAVKEGGDLHGAAVNRLKCQQSEACMGRASVLDCGGPPPLFHDMT